MSIKNQVQLIGNVGKEVETVEFDNGGKLAKFSLATNENYKDKEGNKQTSTQWHNIIAFGKLAEIVEEHLKKGDQTAITGKLTYNSYEDKDGNKRRNCEVKADEVLFLGGKTK